MEEYFCNVDGEYFYSINGTKVLELLCVNNMENVQIKLTGLGSIKIKSKCFAKYNTLLLTGSSTVLLNGTYQISKLLESHTNINISFLPNENIKNISLIKLNEAKLDTNLNLDYNYNYNAYHFFIIYIFLIFVTCILSIIIIVHCKKIYLKSIA